MNDAFHAVASKRLSAAQPPGGQTAEGEAGKQLIDRQGRAG